MVESLTRGRIAGTDGAHLDPDLRRDAIPRTRGWRPIFGQAGAAQSHLARHRVGAGDLFLFFGSFRRAEKCGNAFRFDQSAPKLHVIFGWLQVGEVRPVTDALAKEIPWTRKHPHLSEPARYKSNTLYLASERLTSLNVDSPGAGIFDQLRPELVLTETDPYNGCARTHPALLSLQTESMDRIRDLTAPAISIPRPGIRARPRRISRSLRLAPKHFAQVVLRS